MDTWIRPDELKLDTSGALHQRTRSLTEGETVIIGGEQKALQVVQPKKYKKNKIKSTLRGGDVSSSRGMHMERTLKCSADLFRVFRRKTISY